MPQARQGEQVVRTACRGCHGVCQVLAHVQDGRVVKISGDPESPTSAGFLCPKGAAAPQVLYHKDRLTRPLRRVGQRGENRWQAIGWEEALTEMARRMADIRQDSGAEYFAMGQGTGRPYTEFTLRFAHSFGTPNFVSPGHVCYLPRVIASGLTMGGLPVADLYGMGGQMPRCILLWGCNITETGSADGMCGGTLARALKQAEKVIVVDPRKTGPAQTADHWLQLTPGSEGALALAFINVIIGESLYDADFVANHTVGFKRLARHVADFTPEAAGPVTGLSPQAIRDAARAYATTKPACLQWGNGVDMSVCGFQTGRSLLTLMAITGNLDVPGGDVFWVPPDKVRQKSLLTNHDQAGRQFLPPGQAEKMIGAGKFPFAPGTHPPTFWRSAVSGFPYRVRGMWIVGSNPLLTQTPSLVIEEALKNHLEFTVVSDLFMTPTAQLADLVLPAAHWLETDDLVNFHKIWCTLARRKLAQVGESRDDRAVMLDLAHRLGMEKAFPWPSYRAYLDWLLEDTGLDFDQFAQKGILTGQMRYRKYQEHGFHTPSGKVELYSEVLEKAGSSPLPVYRQPPLSPLSNPAVAIRYPLILMGGNKIKQFFHSELRQVESLRRAVPDPVVDIHPDTAAELDIADGDWVWLETRENRVTMRAKVSDIVAPGVVNASFAWWFPEEEPPEYGWKKSSVNLLFGEGHYDPDTGAEPLKCYLCSVYKE